MKIYRFLLMTIFLFILSPQLVFSDEAKMKKGLEIFNETAGCAVPHT